MTPTLKTRLKLSRLKPKTTTLILTILFLKFATTLMAARLLAMVTLTPIAWLFAKGSPQFALINALSLTPTALAKVSELVADNGTQRE